MGRQHVVDIGAQFNSAALINMTWSQTRSRSWTRWDDRMTQTFALCHGLAHGHQELPSGQRVERSHRLVEEQEPGLLGEGESQRDLGPLATRQCGDGPVHGHVQAGQAVAGALAVHRALRWAPSLMWSSALKRLYRGTSWARYPMSARNSSERRGPSEGAADTLGDASPTRSRSNVVLPAPFGPRRAYAPRRHLHRAVLERPQVAVLLAEPTGLDGVGRRRGHHATSTAVVRGILAQEGFHRLVVHALGAGGLHPLVQAAGQADLSARGRPLGRRATKVPTPWRPSTRPSCSSSR